MNLSEGAEGKLGGREGPHFALSVHLLLLKNSPVYFHFRTFSLMAS